jgi:hypothetical protein
VSECCGKCSFYQRGGAFTVRAWLTALLLGAAIASGAMNWYQYQHRALHLSIMMVSPTSTPPVGVTQI